jgi:hypothetical protein
VVERKRTSSSTRSTAAKSSPVPEIDDATSIPDAITVASRLNFQLLQIRRSS